ncbi:N-6 DNA Methylase [Candidatus Electrothrix aarhusensis]|uniref:site-specific DNA-methyltransferase (adenine-specific) n=1 Tax=Candidatus Electrothrix aarhusensis TaxID=1859131 RepID=A0A3S4T6E5_9BACT|nr:N-6 DNA Methylase [Candidatus Electrothrix aarhusensis]
MRRKMVEADLVECVIGLGPNLFYNSPMEACLLITRTRKAADRQGKVLFINAVKEVRQDKTIGFLEDAHIERIFNAYQAFTDQEDFAALVTTEEILEKNGNMAINRYVRSERFQSNNSVSFEEAYAGWQASSNELQSSMTELFKVLEAS